MSLSLALALSALGCPSASIPDAGLEPLDSATSGVIDASAARDGALAADAASEDAAPPSDAAAGDTGTASDAASDAGATSDTGAAIDASPSPDGGDAEVADAEPADAAPADAGTTADAETADAEAADAEPADAEAADAEPADAEAADAEPADAEAADAEPADAGFNPVPEITLLTPPGAFAGGGGFDLTVHGTGFVPASSTLWNGAALPTTFISETELVAIVAAADVLVAATASIAVMNPAPGGGRSSIVPFSIVNPAPLLASLSPPTAVAGSSAFTLTARGSGFVTTSILRWNGSDRATTYRDSSTITAEIPAADIAGAGEAVVSVFNPAPAGGLSSGLVFLISERLRSIVLGVSIQNASSPSHAGSVTSIQNAWIPHVATRASIRNVAPPETIERRTSARPVSVRNP